MSDCNVCNATMVEPTDIEEASPVCNSCAQEMLGCATNFEIEAFLNVEAYDPETAYVLREFDTGPSIEHERHGPWSMGEAYRRAKLFAEDGDLNHLAALTGSGDE